MRFPTDDELEQAARAWPHLALDPDRFANFVRVGEARTDPLLLSETYLACACADGVPGAIEAFEGHCMSVVDAALSRMPDARSLVDEVKQIIRERLFVGRDGKSGAISTYSGRGSLRGWVRVIAVREALHLLNASSRRVAVDDEVMFDALAPGGQDQPELAYLKNEYRAEFRRAFRNAVSRLDSRERTALRMHVLDGLSIDQIGRAFRVHRATAARWLAGARASLLSETRNALMGELAIDRNQVDSIIRLIQSNLSVSLDTALS